MKGSAGFCEDDRGALTILLAYLHPGFHFPSATSPAQLHPCLRSPQFLPQLASFIV